VTMPIEKKQATNLGQNNGVTGGGKESYYSETGVIAKKNNMEPTNSGVRGFDGLTVECWNMGKRSFQQHPPEKTGLGRS